MMNLRGMLMMLMMLMWMLPRMHLLAMMMGGLLCLMKTSTWKVDRCWNIRRVLPSRSVALHRCTPLWYNHPIISRLRCRISLLDSHIVVLSLIVAVIPTCGRDSRV